MASVAAGCDQFNGQPVGPADPPTETGQPYKVILRTARQPPGRCHVVNRPPRRADAEARQGQTSATRQPASGAAVARRQLRVLSAGPAAWFPVTGSGHRVAGWVAR